MHIPMIKAKSRATVHWLVKVPSLTFPRNNCSGVLRCSPACFGKREGGRGVSVNNEMLESTAFLKLLLPEDF